MLEPTDIEFKKVPEEVFAVLGEDSSLRFHIKCPECDFGKDVPHTFLGKKVRCPKCEHDFTAEWGSLVEAPAGNAVEDATSKADQTPNVAKSAADETTTE